MTERGAMVSVLGRMIVEARTDATVLAILGRVAGTPAERVVGGEAPDNIVGGPFVLMRRIGPILRKPRAPFAAGRVQIDTYGRSPAEATELYNAISDVFSAKGPRRSPAGVAIYLSIEELGGQAVLDPDVDQPLERTIVAYSIPLAQAGS